MPEGTVDFSPFKNLMQADEIFNIVSELVDLGVTKVRFTGGEPLVRKDAKHIISLLSTLPIELAITTNGYLLDQYIDFFKEIGLSSVNISLDTLKEDKFKEITKRDFFHKVLDNIKKASEAGLNVKINTVVMRGINDDEIVDFVQWSNENDYAIRFIEFMPFNGNKWDWTRVVKHDEILSLIEQEHIVTRTEDAKNDTSKNFSIEGFKGSFAIISSISKPFCGSCNRIRLTADGKLKNCLFSSGEKNVLAAFRNGESMSEIFNESLIEKKAERAGLDFNQKSGIINADKRSMFSIGG
jgi:cyclic pyranopterin phosphate synthase